MYAYRYWIFNFYISFRESKSSFWLLTFLGTMTDAPWTSCLWQPEVESHIPSVGRQHQQMQFMMVPSLCGFTRTVPWDISGLVSIMIQNNDSYIRMYTFVILHASLSCMQVCDIFYFYKYVKILYIVNDFSLLYLLLYGLHRSNKIVPEAFPLCQILLKTHLQVRTYSTMGALQWSHAQMLYPNCVTIMIPT